MTLGLQKLATDGFSEWSQYYNLCVAGHGSHDRPFLQLEVRDRYMYLNGLVVIFHETNIHINRPQNCPGYAPEGDVLQLQMTSEGLLVDQATGYCIEVSDGNTVGGGLLVLSPCKDPSSPSYVDQQWNYNEATGEVTTKAHDLCLTAGWPFLTGIAFKSMSGENMGKTVVVLMNEADVSTSIVLHDIVLNKDVRFGISDRAIQTFIY